MEMVACVQCGTEIEKIEVFVGGICVECHAAKWEASEEDFESMVATFGGKGIFG
jgi:hypothetical protein